MPYNSLISRTDAAATQLEQVSDLILGGLENNSAALTLFRRLRMASNQTRMPVLSALPTAYFVDGDTGLKQTTEAAWTSVYINVEELAAIIPIPEAVIQDSGFDIEANVVPLVQQAIGRALDAAIFFGTNKPSSWPTAIVTAAVSAGNVVARGTNAAAAGGLEGDFSQLFATVEADGYDVNGLIANVAYRGRLRDVRGTTGERLITAENVFGVVPQYPMRGQWPTGLSAAEAIAGDFTMGIIGVRQDITVKRLDQAVITDAAGLVIYNLAQQDMIALRVVFRVGFAVANPINYDQGTEASRYPFAVMRSPAS